MPTITPTARDIANYFLSLVDDDAGEGLTNLKLQKLAYYAQGFHLAIKGTPLFKDEIQAWQHGPVSPSLYGDFKQYAAGPIPRPTDDEIKTAIARLNSEQKDLLDEVFTVYGQFSASKLRCMTHEEPPWKEAIACGPRTAVSHDTMANYFKTLLA